MNLFQVVFLDIVLLIFPLLVYLIYLSTNKNISIKSKKIYLNLSLVTSFFLMYNFGMDKAKLIPLLALNSIIILSFLEDNYISANFFAVLIILVFSNIFDKTFLLLIIYIIVNVLYLIKIKIKLNNVIFTQIFIIISSIIFVIWVYKYNIFYYDIYKLLEIIICYIFITNILCLMYETAKNILKTHLTLKELSEEKQIRLSLFKITHEIKNPIAVCKGYLDMLNMQDQKQVEKYIPIIKSEIQRLLSLLQDFLLINKNNLNLDIMDFNVLIEDSIDKLNPLLKERKIKLVTDLIDDEIFVNGDYNRLSQVLLNILKNSIEAIDKSNGEINILTKLHKNKFIVIIKDNGTGMAKEILNKMREPFYTTKSRGSGLGVSLIYEIIEAHGGKVLYQSKENVGTKVTLQIPICE